MKPVRELFKKFRSSDGRIRAITASGVLALVAVVALAVGVLPAIAIEPGPTTTHYVDPVGVDWGGGDGACKSEIFTLDGTEQRLPSAADNELHIQNPTNDTFSDGTVSVKIEVNDDDTAFTFTVMTPGYAVYDVVVNGGKKSNHYDYDEENYVTDENGNFLDESGTITTDPAKYVLDGPVQTDSHLTAPEKEKKEGELHKLSHINLCYDLQPTLFDCGATAEPAVKLGDDATFTTVEARIFANFENTTCEKKLGFFFTDWPETTDPDVLLDFGVDDNTIVAGRLDITKDFGSTAFVDLEYLHDALTQRVDVSWCNIRDAEAADLIDANDTESPFHDVLGSELYPTLEGVLDVDPNPDTTGETGEVKALACKVHVEEKATGTQYNVIYFEFVDPNFF